MHHDHLLLLNIVMLQSKRKLLELFSLVKGSTLMFMENPSRLLMIISRLRPYSQDQ